MAIKGGDLIMVGNSVVFDRVQSGGPGQLNLNVSKIYELGNYQSIGSVLDTPDLSFSLESFDASAEIEAVLTGRDYATDPAGTAYDISTAQPMDVLGQFKRGRSAVDKFDAPFSVAAPYLTLESLSYKFGVKDNASQTATLRGDSLFYNPGSGYSLEVDGTNAANQAVVLPEPAYPYNGDTTTGTRYALGVSLRSGKRLRFGVDYTEAATGAGAAKNVTVTVLAPVATTDKIRVVYTSSTVAVYPQATSPAATAARPAALRGRDILAYVGGTAASDIWTGVQSVSVDYKVNLDKDEELGNAQVVSQDYDVPEVTGSIDIKPTDAGDLMSKLKKITGAASATEALGALQRVPLPISVVLKSPVDGSTLKTLYIPDARFTMPGLSGRVQTKATVTLNFESDSGSLSVYRNARP